MAATWKTIAVFVDDTLQGSRIAAQAAGIADLCGAHLIGIYCINGHPGELPSDAFVRGQTAISEVIAQHQEAQKSLAATVRHRFESVTRRHEISSEFRAIWAGHAKEDTLVNSLHCDLVVLGHPNSPGLPESWSGERLVIASGAPAILIPEGWGSAPIGRNALIGWNASREARRAIVDAMPILNLAQSVTLLVVDATKTADRFGEEPGADISLYLARHNLPMQLRQVESAGRSIADTILSNAALQSCDLVVIGAYSHTRSAELVFGGITRDLLARADVPLLLSH
jgi:nucleotide-binding universal stress UspA family protein